MGHLTKLKNKRVIDAYLEHNNVGQYEVLGKAPVAEDLKTISK